MSRWNVSRIVVVTIALVCVHVAAQEVRRDVPYVPTPQPVVDEMLRVADVKKNDVVYDLGCGDGRIVITAAKRFGATGVGVDIDPVRIKESKENAEKAGVTDKVKFYTKDLFETDFSEATVLTLYLLPEVNLRLRPKILSEVRPGTRVVSHAFDMGDWNADQELVTEGGQYLYYWVVPASVEGTWSGTVEDETGQKRQATFRLDQEFQHVRGTASIDGKEHTLRNAQIKGAMFTFTIDGRQYTSEIRDASMEGTVSLGDGKTGRVAARRADPAQ